MPLNVQVYVFAGCIRTGEDGKIIKVGVGICNLHVNLNGGWGRSICNKNAYSHIVSPINISNSDLLPGMSRSRVLVIEKCYCVTRINYYLPVRFSLILLRFLLPS